MTYNFTDEPEPTLTTTVDATGTAVTLEDGSAQGDYLTTDFSGQQVRVSIAPPQGWVLDTVVWESGGSGTFSVPAAGQEIAHDFTFTISQPGSGTLTNGGRFRIKKAGAPGT